MFIVWCLGDIKLQNKKILFKKQHQKLIWLKSSRPLEGLSLSIIIVKSVMEAACPNGKTLSWASLV